MLAQGIPSLCRRSKSWVPGDSQLQPRNGKAACSANEEILLDEQLRTPLEQPVSTMLDDTEYMQQLAPISTRTIPKTCEGSVLHRNMDAVCISSPGTSQSCSPYSSYVASPQVGIAGTLEISEI